MPMEISQVKNKVRTCSVQYFEDSFTVSYRPGEITSDTEDEDKQLQEAGEKNVLSNRLSKVLSAWDLVDDGKPIAITQEYLATLPSAVLAAIRTSVMEDMLPKPKSAGKSFAR